MATGAGARRSALSTGAPSPGTRSEQERRREYNEPSKDTTHGYPSRAKLGCAGYLWRCLWLNTSPRLTARANSPPRRAPVGPANRQESKSRLHALVASRRCACVAHFAHDDPRPPLRMSAHHRAARSRYDRRGGRRPTQDISDGTDQVDAQNTADAGPNIDATSDAVDTNEDPARSAETMRSASTRGVSEPALRGALGEQCSPSGRCVPGCDEDIACGLEARCIERRVDGCQDDTHCSASTTCRSDAVKRGGDDRPAARTKLRQRRLRADHLRRRAPLRIREVCEDASAASGVAAWSAPETLRAVSDGAAGLTVLGTVLERRRLPTCRRLRGGGGVRAAPSGSLRRRALPLRDIEEADPFDFGSGFAARR